ncbi:unnamed protein product [Durusdinium trenchii]|uniref:Uncharacterized protein n=1 Tax=Durusdinium trenchii TaxID=1381693 RepID=A0ABP0QVA1_9DINO
MTTHSAGLRLHSSEAERKPSRSPRKKTSRTAIAPAGHGATAAVADGTPRSRRRTMQHRWRWCPPDLPCHLARPADQLACTARCR